MKRILLFLVMLLSFANIAESQTYTKSYSNQAYQQQSAPTLYIDWKLTNDGCYGCPSFYWSVNKTYVSSMGQYRFDIWFYSNSYYATGGWASTYVQGMYFNVDGYYLYKEPSWLLFKEKFNSTLTSFYTTNPNPVIKMTWESMSVY